MRVGSASDIYQLFVPRAKTKTPSDGPEEQPAASPKSVGGSLGGDDIAAAFLAKLAKSNFNRDDTNGDGVVDQKEYIDNRMHGRADGYKPRLEDVQNTWSQLDKNGKGSLTEQDYASGFSFVFQAGHGTFSKPIR